MLGDPRIAVLDITTHPDVRVDLMRRAFAAGKHVLSQKPFVEDLATGEALAAEAERRGVKLAVNQNGRWAPHLAYLREAVAAGLVGEVIGAHVAMRWNHGWIAGTAFEAVDDLVLWDFGIHWFDFLASVLGGRALQVRATAARAASQTVRPPLLAEALVSFEGGQASLIFDGATRYGASDATAIVGTRGTISSRGPDLGLQSVELHHRSRRRAPRVEGDLVQRRLRRNDGRASQRDRRRPRTAKFRPRQSLFAQALPGRCPVEPDQRDGPSGTASNDALRSLSLLYGARRRSTFHDNNRQPFVRPNGSIATLWGGAFRLAP